MLLRVRSVTFLFELFLELASDKKQQPSMQPHLQSPRQLLSTFKYIAKPHTWASFRNIKPQARQLHILPPLFTQTPVWPYLYSSKRVMAPQLDAYFKQVDTLSDHFIERLREAVAIPSVSAEDDRRPEVIRVSIFKSHTTFARLNGF